MRNLREVIKRVAFAGLRPQSETKLPLGERLRRRFDRFGDRLAGSPPPVNDPLYESNRTWRQTVKVTVMIVLPFVVVFGLISWTKSMVRQKHRAANVIVPSKLTTDIYHEVLKPSELEVSEMFLQKKVDPATVHGSVRNNSDQKFESAEISFNVTDKDGMLLGAISTTVRNIPPHGTQEFTVVVPQKNAAIILVRDARRL